MALAAVLALVLLVVLVLLVYQRKLIYLPRSYQTSYQRSLPKGALELSYKTSQGRQTAFYIPASGQADKAPKRLWVLFMGNASLGLDWLDLLDSYTRQADTTSSAAQTGFFLVDYPGYGLCQGKPSRQSIRESSEGAFQALAQELKLEPERLEQDLNVLGLSIGTAAGLEFASRHPIQHIILLAPFTSLLDIARRSVGSPLCYLLYDRFDNEQRIRELTRRATAPRIDIFHGSADTLVPPRMGQALAQLSPEHARFHPVEGADHNMILFAAEERVVELMLGAPGEGLSEGRIAKPK